MRISNYLPALPALLAASQFAGAEDARAIQQKLESKYKLTVINAEGGVVTQGAVLALKKNGLIAGVNTCSNDYKDGRISLGGSVLSRAGCTRVLGNSGTTTRPFVMGEKLDVTKIEVKDSWVGFSLISDPINDVIYKAELRLQFPKGTPPDSAKADQLAEEVFSISEADAQAGGGAAGGQAPGGQAPAAETPAPAVAPTPAPEPQQPALAPIEPPPPPPDTPPPTVSLGMTTDQVIAILGQPKLVLEPAKNKKIYTYPAFKVTFVDGKVSNIE
jgi:hypothetical protein